MASVSVSLEVSAPAEQVWQVLVDPSRYDRWLDLHQGFVGTPPSAFTPGTEFGQRVRVLGMPADVRWTVDEVAEPTRVALSGTGPMGIGLQAGYGVEPGAGDASRVTVTMAFSGAAVMAVGGQLEREVDTQLRTSLEKLKGVVEA
jgi:uncharacterized protein YndB with AHSA1/START domain